MESYHKIDLTIKILIFLALIVIIYYLHNIELNLRPIGEFFTTQNWAIEQLGNLFGIN